MPMSFPTEQKKTKKTRIDNERNAILIFFSIFVRLINRY